MQYRPPNANLDSVSQTVSNVTSRWSHLSDIVRYSIQGCAGVFVSTVMFPNYDTQINVLSI